jgi:hypothetical protein
MQMYGGQLLAASWMGQHNHFAIVENANKSGGTCSDDQ